MSRFFFLADLHIWNHSWRGGAIEAGLNARAREQLAALKQQIDMANKAAAHVVILGDVFDRVRPEPQLLAALRDVLGLAQDGVSILVGNHDQVSTAIGDHALRPLETEEIKIYEQPTVIRLGGAKVVEVGIVPFRPGRAEEWLPEAVAALWPMANARRRVLCLHLGISDERTPPWLRDAPDSISVTTLRQLATRHNLQGIFAGNWHQHMRWAEGDLQIVQVGTSMPHNFSDTGPSVGKAAIYEPFDHRVRVLDVPGPRFETVRWPCETILCSNTYYRFVVTHQLVTQTTADILAWTQAGLIAGGEAVADENEIKEANNQATRQTKAAMSFDDALVNWVKDREFNTDKNDVLTTARNFLQKA